MIDERTGNTLPVPMPGQVSGPIMEWWGRAYGSKLFDSTLDPQKDRQQARDLLSALNGNPPLGLKELINTEFVIVSRTFSPAGREENGEEQEWVRTVIQLDDGRFFSFGSLGVYKSLRLYEEIEGLYGKPYPRRFKLVDRSTNPPKQWPVLEPVYEEPAAPAKKK